MAPISTEPEEFEYIVIGGGSGGSGTVSLFLFSSDLSSPSPCGRAALLRLGSVLIGEG
jgi:hypothetical protein